MSKTLAHRLADYTCALRFEDLSKNVVHEVKRRVIDSLGCALGAWNEEPCAIARKVASDFSARHGSTIIGTNHKAPPDWTAFANGCAIRYFDYNDTYLSKEPAHPSDNISAALAVAESNGAAGRELITAIALAYEVQCRFCDAASIRARGWDHVTYGTFSTALACARLMNLDRKKTRHAVNIAGVAGAAMRVPLVAVVLRRGYGLGAQAMTGGSLHEPVLTVAWPGAHLGPMGLEGAVRMGLRKELEAIADDDEREERVRQATAAAQENAKALNAAQMFEIDDVIDPADTRRIIAETLTAATAHTKRAAPRRFVDTW